MLISEWPKIDLGCYDRRGVGQVFIKCIMMYVEKYNEFVPQWLNDTSHLVKCTLLDGRK
jgi:hypothetical protein